MKNKVFVFFLLSFGIFTSCNENLESSNNSNPESSTVGSVNYPDKYEVDGLKIYPSSNSAQFPGASLEFKQKPNLLSEDGNINFNFQVGNYELGIQTPDAPSKGIANSAKGQHIHLIVDNGPYSAHYETGFEKSFDKGHHIAIAFLSRSYHESVKEANAHQVFQFTCGQSSDIQNIDLNQEMLFYSRPKGTYSGSSAKKILLDFFLKNTSIAPGENYIKLTINDKTSVLLDDWQAYFIEGLPMGENKINLQLLNSEGFLIQSPMNDITRTFTLTEENS